MDNYSSNKASLFSDLVIEIFRLNRQLLDAGDQLTRDVGLSSARWQVLGVIEHGPTPVSNVARVMGLTRQSVQQTADALEKEGFIRYQDNPHHRRAKLMTLTAKGHEALNEVQRLQTKWAENIADHHSIDGMKFILLELRAIRRTLETNLPHD
ncbi:MAG TPA: MarR family transcriptional regulator [Candidatus Bathyarchaeia archaeon]|nr:MarR family transcriptional regulator [Candidatus Bathyarchaeia archaeon]